MLQSKSAQKELTLLYQKMYRAMVERDTTALSSILADNFHLVHMTGYDQPKDEWLSHIESGRMQYSTSVKESVRVDVKGTKATLIGQNRVEADIWGVKGVWPLRLEIECSYHNGRWLMLSAHASTY